MELSSGELYFRASDVLKQLDSLKNFKTFLICDINSDSVSLSNSEKLLSLRSLRQITRRHYLTHMNILRDSKKTIDFRRNEILSTTCREINYCMKYMRSFIDAQDNTLLKLVLSYFSILKYELLENRKLVDIKYSLYKQKLKSLQMSKDMKLFAHHLNVETKGNVSVQYLSSDSTQFKRCHTAVMDNVNHSHLEMVEVGNLQVIHAIKLQHIQLARQFKKATDAARQGKVKGLFCIVTKDQVYALTTYGLHAQRNIAAYSTVVDTDEVPLQPERSIPDLFQSSWFSLPKDFDSVGDSGTSRDRDSVRNFGLGHKMASSQSGFPCLRFSKQSTTTALAAVTQDDLMNGFYVSLCRVFISNCYSIDNGPISDYDVQYAVKKGFDCVYCNSQDEYIFLDPTHVLPEFLMFAQTTGANASSGADDPRGRGNGQRETVSRRQAGGSSGSPESTIPTAVCRDHLPIPASSSYSPSIDMPAIKTVTPSRYNVWSQPNLTQPLQDNEYAALTRKVTGVNGVIAKSPDQSRSRPASASRSTAQDASSGGGASRQEAVVTSRSVGDSARTSGSSSGRGVSQQQQQQLDSGSVPVSEKSSCSPSKADMRGLLHVQKQMIAMGIESTILEGFPRVKSEAISSIACNVSNILA